MPLSNPPLCFRHMANFYALGALTQLLHKLVGKYVRFA